MPKVVPPPDTPSGTRSVRLKQLVDLVLDQLPKPHTEDVIEDVFVAIEANPEWKKSYDRMVYESGKPTVTSWASFWISHSEQRTGDQRETAARSSLIESYSKLSAPAVKRGKKVKEPDALKAMHDHFTAHRANLGADIRDQREVIVALIMDGMPVEAAFAQAMEKPAFAW
jgi:hypothetical protein